MGEGERCGRCGRIAPPPVAGTAGQAAHGWTSYEDDDGRHFATVCPDCHTDEEIDAAEASASPPWPEGLWAALRLIEVRERRRGIASWWHGRTPR